MNKPLWKDAPPWASYLAQDITGKWHWYEEEPIAGAIWWKTRKRKERAIVPIDGWVTTLEGKPE